MQQEDLNEMMRLPWETRRSQIADMNTCPKCGERYCGDGIALCVECAALAALAANQAKGDA